MFKPIFCFQHFFMYTTNQHDYTLFIVSWNWQIYLHLCTMHTVSYNKSVTCNILFPAYDIPVNEMTLSQHCEQVAWSCLDINLWTPMYVGCRTVVWQHYVYNISSIQHCGNVMAMSHDNVKSAVHTTLCSDVATTLWDVVVV